MLGCINCGSSSSNQLNSPYYGSPSYSKESANIAPDLDCAGSNFDGL